MKKIILILTITTIACCFLNNKAHSQTLQFSQVLWMLQGETDTVPANHIWKLENWAFIGEMIGGAYSRPIIIKVDGTTVYLSAMSKDGNSVQYDSYNPNAYWFPENTIINIPNSGTISGIRALSIIEFEVAAP